MINKHALKNPLQVLDTSKSLRIANVLVLLTNKTISLQNKAKTIHSMLFPNNISIVYEAPKTGKHNSSKRTSQSSLVEIWTCLSLEAVEIRCNVTSKLSSNENIDKQSNNFTDFQQH